MSHDKRHKYLGHWRTLLSPNTVTHQLFTNTSFLPQSQQVRSSNSKLSINTQRILLPKLSKCSSATYWGTIGHVVSCIFMQNFTGITSLISHKHITTHSGRLLQKATTCERNKWTLSQMLLWDFGWSPTAWFCSKSYVLKGNALLRTIPKTSHVDIKLQITSLEQEGSTWIRVFGFISYSTRKWKQSK